MNQLKTIVLFVCMALISAQLHAEKVDAEKAGMLAQRYVQSMRNVRTGDVVQLKHCAIQRSRASLPVVDTPQAVQDTVFYYVFNIDEGAGGGFVIVSGDNTVTPVLAYSENGSYDENNLPPNFAYWMDCLQQEIRWAIRQNLPQSETMQQKWDKYLNSNELYAKSSVEPLLQTKWNQNSPFNNQCPLYSGSNRSVTGCVATAMAQIMKYYQHPARGSGLSPAYTTSTWKISLPALNFTTATNYDWANMLNIYSGYTTTTQQTAVSTLMYHCGHSVKMNYGPLSGASSSNVPLALSTFFGYDKSMQIKYRNHFDIVSWNAILMEQIDNGMPVLYSGDDGESGHAFLCDGYDNTGKFHFNWGWGGLYDGYFVTTTLNPGTGGAGSGSGVFNQNQEIVINIKPDEGGVSNYEVGLLNTFSSSTTSILPNVTFSVSARFENAGWVTVPAGTYGAALVNNDGQIVEVVGSYTTSTSLPAGNYFMSPFNMNSCRVQTATPGQYKLRAVFRPSGVSEWKTVTLASNCPSSIDFTVLGSEIECSGISKFPYHEGFENNGTNFPACWSQEHVTGTTEWQVIPSNDGKPAHGGSYKARLNYESYTSNTTRLVMPRLILTGLNNPTLKFWHTQEDWFGDQDVLRIYYKTSSAGTWTLLKEFLTSVPDWTERTISLPNASADYYIAFVGETHYGFGIQLDDISITDELETFNPPKNVIANVADRKIEVRWNEPDPEILVNKVLEGYVIYRFTEGQAESAWTLLSDNLTQTGYTDLDWLALPSENFQYAVKAKYTGNHLSVAALSNVVKLTNYEVAVSANPSAGGTVTGGGSYAHGSNVTVTATPNEKYHFVNWTEKNVEVSTNPVFTFTVAEHRTLTAHFSTNQYAVNYSTPANGTLSVMAGSNPVKSGSMVEHGTVLTITATPDANFYLETLTVNGDNFTSGSVYVVSSTTNIVCTFKSNNNADLSALTVSTGTLAPAFNAAIISYSVNVPYDVSSISVSATTADANAKLTGTGAHSLDVGSNIIQIVVTSRDEITTKTYTLTVNRATASNNADLSALTVSTGTLAPEFNAAINSYSVNVPYIVSSISVSATTADANATLTGTGAHSLDVGSNTIQIEVTAQDGTTKKIYTLHVIRQDPPNNDASLESILINNKPAVPKPDFINIWEITVDFTTSITIVATPAHPAARIQEGHQGAKSVTVGINLFEISVIAENGNKVNYILILTVKDLPNHISEYTGQKLTAYPIPARERLTVSGLEGNGILTVLDASGKQWIRHNITACEETIDVSALPKGIYIIQIVDEINVRTIKIIIE